MTIAEADAVEVARRFVSGRGRLNWDEATEAVSVEHHEGRSAWVVKATDSDPSEGEPWMRTAWAPVHYFVDRTTGELFGFATERSRTIFNESCASAP